MHVNVSHAHLSLLSKRIELRRLFTTYGLVSIALSFVGAFGPIYLFRLGYSLTDILTYFLLTAAIKIVVLPFVFKIMHSIGSNRVMAIGVVFFIVNFLLFATLEAGAWPLWLLAVPKAIGNACYYGGYRVNFAIAHTKEKTGSQAAFAQSMILTLGIFAPLVGGVLSFFWSVSGVYFAAIILFIFAGAIIWNAPQEIIKKIQFKNIPKGAALKDYGSNFSYSFSGLSDLFVWPILISLIIPSYVGIGAIATFFAVLSIVVTIYVGKRIDNKIKKNRYLGYGVSASFMYSFGRLFATTTPHLIGLGFLSALGSSLTSLSYDKRYYTNATKRNWLEYLFAQEIANALPWILYFPILIVASLYLDINQLLYLGVLITIPFIFGTLLIRRENETVRLRADSSR